MVELPVPASRTVVPAVIGGVVGLAVLVALGWLIFAPSSAGGPSGVEPVETPAPRWAPPGAPPVAAATPGAGIAGLVDADWADAQSAATGIPRRALVAYAGAALVKAQQMPQCGLSWTTLAGIGAAESDHGRHGGSSIGPDGTVTPPILGVALAGGTTANIPDSDKGAIDGDAAIDRAVGPMQLIPQTWRNWHVDANGDGVQDPQNIDDAVTASANYLCRSSIHMDTEAGWRAAVSAYNSSDIYLGRVARFATAYNAAR
ncbi:MAG TPA: lytic murein transglycosylase [Pseudolysinimonas sp.]|nr:lytic murein transglycosylase [Pseudolysinimonas sp.]